MESVSLILILVGAGIIGVVLLLRLGLGRSSAGKISTSTQIGKDNRLDEPDFDPLFAVDANKEEISGSVLANMGKIMVEYDEAQVSLSQSATQDVESQEAAHEHLDKRRPPRVADDPHRVVVLNVMARVDQGFSGGAVRDALVGLGLEYGDWQIFHYYSHANGDAPPLFSLANMVKPGHFDLDGMNSLNTAGLSLFMVPAGEEDDIVAFDTMLHTGRQLAEELGGELRDARRSVLTRQAIGQIREQLNEWRCKAQTAQH